WIVILWFAAKRPEDETAPSLFLAIALISPLYFHILHARDDSGWGLPIWILLAARLYLSLDQKERSIRWSIALFLLLCLISIPFSLYPWRNIQFLFLNCACVAVYCATSGSRSKQEPVLAGYLHQALSLIVFAILSEKLLLSQFGLKALQMRLWIVMFHNDLVPNLLISSAILLYFFTKTEHRLLKAFVFVVLPFLGCLLLLTFSRNAWISYFLMIALFLIFSEIKNAIKIGFAAGCI